MRRPMALGKIGLSWVPRCFPVGIVATLSIVTAALTGVPPVSGQGAWRATSEPMVNRILMLAPREYQQQLRRAEESIEREQFSDAIQALAELLEPNARAGDASAELAREDYFIGQPGDAQLSSSLRTEARRLLGRLPARGKELYRLNYGATAQRGLDQALTQRDEALLAEIAWRYFHTDAGYAANFLLGRHHLDRGRPLAASMCFDRLAEAPEAVARFDPELSLLLASSCYQSGNLDRARQVLTQLKVRQPGASFRIAGRSVPLFADDEDPLTWLARQVPRSDQSETQLTTAWQMHRGLPSRNPTSTAGTPLLRHRWRVPLTSTPDDEELIAWTLNERREQGTAAIPSVTPLVMDNIVLMRTPDNLLAVDFETGKRIWEYPWAEPPSALVSDADAPARNRQQRRHQLEERLWMDAAYGQLSSDGESVFLVDELSYVGSGATDPTTQMFRNIALPDASQPREFNSLVALEIATQGKYRWRVGGSTGEDEPALARAFFLGPPLVLGDSLYVLAEVRGDVSLFVLDAATGRLQWSQQLAHVGVMNIIQDVTRRLAGASPSYSDGVLVCPTSAGALVAVDIPTRSLLWGVQYPRSFTLSSGNLRLNFARAHIGLRQDRDGGWLDSAPLIGEGRVVVTPLETDDLICLDLLSGKTLWSKSRDGELLFAACLFQGQVIVVGDTRVVSLGLDDGQVRWTLPFDESAAPSAPSERPAGRGFLTESRYLLPTTARLLTIDLESGQLVDSAMLSEPLGNLIPYADQIVSLSADGLTAFYQAEPLREAVQQRLATAPDDPWATEHLGLLQLANGERLAALKALRDAYRTYPPRDDRREGTRALLVETLLGVLEEDEAASDDVIREVDGLIERPVQRERYLRLMGQRMLREGKATDAFRSFLELARQQVPPANLAVLEDPRLPLVTTGGSHHLVRRDRFVRSGIRKALRLADDNERANLDGLIREQQQEALAANRISRLQDFLRIFADHPLAEPIRLELAERYLEFGSLLQVEFVLSPMLDGQPTPQVGRAWVLMARAMQAAERGEMLDRCLERLGTNWSSEPLQEGKTGGQWAAEIERLRQSPPTAETVAWPYGRVQVERLKGNPSNLPTGFQAYSNYRPIQLHSSEGILAARLRIAYDATGTNSIVISDSLGREQVRVPGTSGRIKRFVDGTLTAKSLGHLALINFGHGVLAANALDTAQGEDQQVLWPKNYTELLDGADPRASRMQSVAASNDWGQQQTQISGRRVHSIGPVEFDGIVYLQGNSLYCVDPLTGHPLWIRHDVPAGAHVWGDEEVVMVVPTSDQEGMAARVFRFLDGEELELRHVPPTARIWSTRGRNVLTWDEVQEEDQQFWRLRLFDPWTERDVWQRDFPPGSRGDLSITGDLAIVDPADHLVVLDADTGVVRVEQDLRPNDRPLLSVYWRVSPDRALLIRKFEPRATAGTKIESFPDEVNCPLIDGDVYAFDRRSGQSLWPIPAVIEGYGLPLDQPDDVPVLAFVRQIARSNSRSRRPTLSLLCLDKRDGRLLLEVHDLNFSYGSFFMSGDPLQHTVSLRLLNVHNYLLTFTDAPQPPEPPAQTGTASSRSRRAGLSNILGAVFDAVGRQLEKVGGGGEDDESEKD